MSLATQKEPKPLLPPDERFWQRYSPHHEFPLAGATSFFIHGLVIGTMVLAAFWYLFQRENDILKPPSMDVVKLSGGGDGSEGAGAEPGLPGEPHEAVIPSPEKSNVNPLTDVDNQFKDTPQIELNIPEVNANETKTDVENLLKNLEKETANQIKKEDPTIKNPAKLPAKIVIPGTGNPQGKGGQGGSGGGIGKGTKGMGLGQGGPGGRKATKAEIYAWRWRFDLTGNGREHANKLAAFGVTLAIPTPDGKYLFIQDLRRRPVDLQPGKMEKYKEAVKWKNQDPGSMQELARELKLDFVPSGVIMLLPQDREEKMAAEEMRFAQKSGRSPLQIQATWFDFQLRNGVYEPVAIRQQ